jgi:hypothetical protein
MRSGTSPQDARQCRNQPQFHPTWSQPHVGTEVASEQIRRISFRPKAKPNAACCITLEV